MHIDNSGYIQHLAQISFVWAFLQDNLAGISNICQILLKA